MNSKIFLTIGACLLFLVADALVLEKRDGLSVIAFPLQRVVGIPPPQNSRLSKRSFQSTLSDILGVLAVPITLGTPPKLLMVGLDTGSSDLVVETDSSSYCALESSICNITGTYDANSSYTYVYVNSELKVAYDDNTSATGDYALDYLTIGGVVIKDMQFGIMYQGTTRYGLLGIGFPGIESTAVYRLGQYNNFPILLVNQGYIQSAAYSLWLNGDQTAAGTNRTILFGGVDTDKFYGSLVTLPFVAGPFDTGVQEFFVTLQGVQMSNGTESPTALNGGSTPVPALLDSGTSIMQLPAVLAQSILSALNAVITSDNLAYVDCTLASSPLTVDFIFTGITISVPLSQLVLPIYLSPTQCLLGLEGSAVPGATTILGDTFLSSAYVVFDLDNKEAHIAPAVFNSTTENVVQIGSGPNAVPSVTGIHISRSSATSSTSTIATTTSSTTSRITPNTKPSHCNHDNCLRAMIRHSATLFCSGYLAGSVEPIPSDVSTKCAEFPSRISSGCLCLQTDL